MKKILVILSSVMVFAFTASVNIQAAALTSNSAKAELTNLYKRYEETDYHPENWDQLTNAYNEGILAIDNSSTEEDIITNMNIAARKMISIDHRGGSVEICISAEKLTLQKGFIVLPELYRTSKYDSVAQATADFLNDKFQNKTRNPFKASGTIEHDFNLTGIFEVFVDTGDDEYDEIDVPVYLRKYVGTSLPQRSDKGYIRAGDYTTGSCFVLSVNNKFPNISASGIPVLEEDIIRWQFSIYGNGADVGSTAFKAENPIANFADKSELMFEFAKLHKLNDMKLLLSDESNAKKYSDVLQVLEIATISQTAVKRALDKLETIIPSSKIKQPEKQDNVSDKADTSADKNTAVKEETKSEPSEALPEENKPEIQEENTAPAFGFTDIPENHFAVDHIKYLSSRNIISGRDEFTFDPEDTVTRAEFSAMLARTVDAKNTDTELPFKDISENAWYKDAVLYAYTSGITNGTGFDTFSPDKFITREDMSAMLIRYCTAQSFSLPESAELKFEDSSFISDYAKDAVSIMQQLGIINGKANNKFDPKGFATRAETAKMLSVLLQMINK